jgi:signal transduction histidine kinase
MDLFQQVKGLVSSFTESQNASLFLTDKFCQISGQPYLQSDEVSPQPVNCDLRFQLDGFYQLMLSLCPGLGLSFFSKDWKLLYSRGVDLSQLYLPCDIESGFSREDLESMLSGYSSGVIQLPPPTQHLLWYISVGENQLGGFLLWIVPGINDLQSVLNRIHKANGQIQKMVEVLEELVYQKDVGCQNLSMLYKCWHEINNPLSVIKAAAQLGELVTDPGKKQEAFSRIQNEVDRISSLLQDVRRFIKPETPGLSPVPAVIFITEFAQEVSERIDNKDVRMVKLVSDDEAQMLIDKDFLKEALHKMADNSLEAGADKLTIKGEVQGDYYQIIIEDNGSGVPDELVSKVFEPFFSTKGQWGMGLSIAQSIIRKHQGDIRLDSDDSGTIVSVRIPLANEAETIKSRIFSSGT